MRPLIAMMVILAVALGCGQKKKAETAAVPEPQKSEPGEQDTTAADRSRLIANLKTSNPKTRKDAALELMDWVDSDPETITLMLELLKDRTTTGSGKILVTQFNSTREAAARVLLGGGPKGEAALKEKGLALLREGLSDTQPAIREHSVYTIGLLGPLGRPLSNDVLKLCTNADPNVRGRAFDALKAIGIADVPAFLALLNDEDPEVARLAAEQVGELSDIPISALGTLVTALNNPALSVRLGAASVIATLGPAASSAATGVAKAIQESYPAELNTATFDQQSSKQVFWRALEAIGPQAVPATTELLAHANPFVKVQAMITLGKIGPPARSASGKLKELMNEMKADTRADVRFEAACALLAMGAEVDSAQSLIKQGIEAPGEFAQYAIEALPRLGSAGKPFQALAFNQLKGSNVYARYAAIGLVGTLPPAEAAPYAVQIAPFIADALDDIRLQTAKVLLKLGVAASPAAEAVGRAIVVEKVEEIRQRMIEALLAMGTGGKPALPALLTLARDKQRSALDNRVRAIRALTEVDPTSKEVAQEILAALGDGEALVRIAAASAAARLEPLTPEVLARLVAMAKTDRETQPRLAALQALALAGPRARATRGEVEAIASGPQPGLALWATVAVAAMNGDIARASTVVHTALAGHHSPARAAATEALLLIGPTATDLPVLIKLLKDLDARTREAAARCLGRLGEKAGVAFPQLVLLLEDREGPVRIAAVEALGELGKAAIPATEKLRGLIKTDRLVESAASKTLEKIGSR